MMDLEILMKKVLDDELRVLKKHGVDHLGYRYFLPDGRSFGRPTLDIWYKIERTEEFYEAQKKHLSRELLNLHTSNFSYVTRSSDHKPNAYLAWMHKMKIDNSIGIYKFDSKRIDSLFFILDAAQGEKRDVLINNIRFLEKHVNSLSKKMNNFQKLMEESGGYDIKLEQEVCNIIFPKGKREKYVNIVLDGRSINLTSREIDILLLLSFATSNKVISDTTGIGIKSVEKYISSLKSKLCVNSKNELISLTNKPQIQVLIKKR